MLDWQEAFTAGIAVVGGKGWNLARLHRYGFPVPAGGVLPAALYRQACGVPAVASAMAALRGVPPERAAEPEVVGLLERVQAALRSVPLEVPAPVPGLVAVRSSAVAEDGREASFAGIHESFLDVTDVPAAVRACWASLWTPRALAYRRRLGLSDDAVACAVVICAMVPAVSAGVAFTCDPLSGRRDLVVIDAGLGLGDRLVRGEVTPQRIVLRRVRGRFRVDRTEGEPVLAPEQALQLARLAWRVHWALGEGQDPQDLEWAWDGARFHLLQARPVTRVPHHTFPGVRDVPVWWSNANMKDAVPGVVSTHAWSFIQEAIPDVLYALPHAVGYEVPPGMPITRRFDGHAYFDFTGMQWGFYDSIGMKPEETVRAIGGHQPAIPVPPGNPMNWRRFLARLRMLKRLWDLPRRLREAWLRCHPPDVLRQDATPWAEAAAPPRAGALTGLGVASGVVEGVARVLRHPHEGHRLARGEILVAPSTDPGWTPLFLRAGGIVMESGGYLSHGAIVAREFGLPGVTNVAGVLDRVQDGQRLRVDGDRGTVEVLGAG